MPQHFPWLLGGFALSCCAHRYDSTSELASEQLYEKCAGEECVPPLAEHPEFCFPSTYWGLNRLGQVLGEGGFGKVRIAYQLPNCTEVAAKVVDISKQTRSGMSMKEMVVAEFQLQHRLNHPGVLKVYATGQAQGPVGITWSEQLIFMELVTGGDLFNKLTAGVSPAEVYRYSIEMSDAFRYIHEQSIAHLDIKPENALLTGHGNIKIADFGLAGKYTNPLTTFKGGSVLWSAPERLASVRYDAFKADVWSLGATFFEMNTGTTLFDTGASPKDACFIKFRTWCTQGTWHRPRPSFSQMMQTCKRQLVKFKVPSMEPLVVAMLAMNPTDRPTMKEVHDQLLKTGSSLLQELETSPRMDEHQQGYLQRQHATLDLAVAMQKLQ